jgi:hypothetical protein
MNVAVLGCGPAGLMAAHAVALNGCNPVILSKKQPSVIGGAQYLHEPIPKITGKEPDGRVNFIHYGTETGYAQKVYGNPCAPTSWTTYPVGYHSIWNLRKAYEKLWSKYESKIYDFTLTPDSVEDIQEEYDLVFSTVPLVSLCQNPSHGFENQEVWIIYGQTVLGGGEDRIIYDGSTDFPWYRWSYLFGWSGIEYPNMVHGGLRLRKPLGTTCNCHPGTTRLGRYGTWNKGALTHHAYKGAIDALHAMR